MWVRTFKVTLFCLRLYTFPILICCNSKQSFFKSYISHIRTLCCLGNIIQYVSHRLFIFADVVPWDTFPDKSGLCSLLLATWAGSLNLTKACAIFSVSMIPQACPSHSLQFVRFRHIISVWEISPPNHTHAHTHYRSTMRLLPVCRYFSGYHAKRSGLRRHVQAY